MRRVMWVCIDQLAGHWAKNVIVETTGLPPPNVDGYHVHGLVPHISDLIDRGFWVKHAYNSAICGTGAAQGYIFSGSYKPPKVLWRRSEKDEGNAEVWTPSALDRKGEHIVQFLRMHHPYFKSAFFNQWHSKYIHADFFSFTACQKTESTYATVNVPKGTSDDTLIKDFVEPWMRENTASGRGTPIYVEKLSSPFSDKHHHLIDHVDRNVGRLTTFLEKEGWWKDTVLLLCSDHAYHCGCDSANSDCFVPIDAPRRNVNFCWDHAGPYNCHVWDFKENKPTDLWSVCCRRIAFILSGGALDEKFKGKTIEEAEIIDIPATTADIFSLPYKCDGTSVLRKM